MNKHLNVRLYRPTFVNELADGDMDRRYESCRALLDTFSNAVSRSLVLLGYECAIYRSAQQKCGVLVKGESQFHARAGT